MTSNDYVARMVKKMDTGAAMKAAFIDLRAKMDSGEIDETKYLERYRAATACTCFEPSVDSELRDNGNPLMKLLGWNEPITQPQ